MNLDPKERRRLAEKVLACLRNASPGCTAVLRGSLADGTADEYSDIDVMWEVPDAEFATCVNRFEDILSAVRPVASLRSDPDFQRSGKRRVLFARLVGMPLFWRVDVEAFAESTHRDSGYDVGNPAARGSDWSFTESALMNVVAAIRAILRVNEDEAQQLLRRAYERVGLNFPAGLPPEELILNLAREIANIDPQTKALADEVAELAKEALEIETGA